MIVGSLWISHSPEVPALFRKIAEWKKERAFDSEFHFADVSRGNVDLYCSFVDFISENSSVLGFKAVSVERQGLGDVDRALARLYYLLLGTGIEHDDQTARAPLPRTLSLWKDLEERNRDKIFLAELSDKLKQTAATRFKGQFEIDQLEVVDSQGNPFVQLADLFTSSINRTVNSDSQRDHPKDRFAEYFLRQSGMSRELQQELRQDDIVAHIRL